MKELTKADAIVIERLMSELDDAGDLHPDEQRVLSRLRSAYDLGRPVPDHASGP